MDTPDPANRPARIMWSWSVQAPSSKALAVPTTPHYSVAFRELSARPPEKGQKLVRSLKLPSPQFRWHDVLQRVQFLCRIGAQVDLRSLHVGVTEPQRDFSQVAGRLEDDEIRLVRSLFGLAWRRSVDR